MEKQHILDEIRRTAAANDGVALGRGRFAQETGILDLHWRGTHWARWSDAVVEAGLQPRAPQARPDIAVVLAHLADLVRRLGRFPSLLELRAERAANPAFPSGGSFERLGSKVELIDRLQAFCRATPGYEDVPGILDFSLRAAHTAAPAAAERSADDGYVYLVQSGKHFRFAAAALPERSACEAAIAAEQGARAIHTIRTDDPAGIAAYWQQRYAARKTAGAWYALTGDEVTAIKRRRFM
jgi:hypothetical protein